MYTNYKIKLNNFYIFILTLISFIATIFVQELFILQKYLSLIIFSLFTYFLYRTDKIIFLLLIFLIIHYFLAISSCFYIESGGFVTEQNTNGHPTGGSIRLVSYYLLFLISFIVSHKLLRLFYFKNSLNLASLNINYNIYWHILYISYFSLFIILCTLLYNYGFPLSMELNRFEYFDNFPIIKSTVSKFPILSFMIGLYEAYKPKSKEVIYCRLMMVSIIIANILTGDKFSGIIISIYMYFLAIFIIKLKYNQLLNFNKKIKFLFIFIAILLILLIFTHYYIKNGNDLSLAYDQFLDRALGLQGHLWWGIDNIVYSNSIFINDQYNSLLQYYQNNISGVKLLMYTVSPSDLVDRYIQGGIRFSSGNPAIAIYTLGYIGAIIWQIITGCLLGILSFFLVDSISKNKVLLSINLAIIYLILIDPIIMGDMGVIFTFFFYKYIISFVFIFILSKFSYTKKFII
jgi:hypothetical protein